MNTPLRERCATIGALLSDGGAQVAWSRYTIGVHLRELTAAHNTYGDAVFERLAATLGVSIHTLYDAAHVAATWPPEDFEALVARCAHGGAPLSFSHFIVLSQVPDAGRRARLVETALAEGLSVRALMRIVDAKKPPRARRGQTEAAALLREQTRLTAALLAATRPSQLAPLESAMPAADRKTMTAALRSYTRLKTRIDVVLDTLTAALQDPATPRNPRRDATPRR